MESRPPVPARLSRRPRPLGELAIVVAIAAVSWAGSILAIGVTLVMTHSAATRGYTSPPRFDPFLYSPLAATPLLAWIVLGVMTMGWILNRRCHWLWPVAGSVIGIPWALLFSPMGWTYGSAVPLALYLVYFHLRQPSGFPFKRGSNVEEE